MTAGSDGWRRQPAIQIRVDVVIPVFNEEHVLRRSVRRLHEFFSARIPYRWRLVIAENGSTDHTADVARALCTELSHVDLVVTGRPGRGCALRTAWTQSEADVVSYTDVDLSTDLEEFLPLFHALIVDGHDLAVGSRLAHGARTTRSMKRQVISLIYNALLKRVLDVHFTDAQTGFKALTREVVEKVLPFVKDESWFLDTELLVLAERRGYRIADIPITWVEDDDSRVRILRTAWDDVRGVMRLRRTLRTPGVLTPVLSRSPRGSDK